jgi:hypothetical protein
VIQTPTERTAMEHETQEQDPSKPPSFVTDQATSADSEDKPAVAPDRSEDAPDTDEPQKRAPENFDLDDAVTKTAEDPPS